VLGIDNVTVRFGATTAVDALSLEVHNGERLSVLGPSGSGKSTLLRAIAGLEPLAEGAISWDGQDLARVPVHRRRFGLMFQDYVLFPHLDVARNVRFGLEMADMPRSAADARVAETLELVGLTGFESRLPAELSGGEQQRVALARALAPRPRLLMLDEPLGALDRSLRRSLLDELSDLFSALKLPLLYVTHDHEEALAIGDRVAVMRAGRLEAVMPPRDLWLRPPNEFVARFLGFTNIVGGRLIRPDAFRQDADGEIAGIVRSATFRGDHTLLKVEVTAGLDTASQLDVQADWTPVPSVGEAVRLAVDPLGVVLLSLT
jgi:thiamine transport system ATP-binding protein